MDSVLSDIQAALRQDGLALFSASEQDVRQLLSQRWSIAEETEVRQHPGVDTYLSGREAVPLHTDHPEAELVAWRCEVQDTRDGASLLVDGHAVIRAMGERADALKRISLHVPPQLPRQTIDRRVVWDGQRLYYAPWYQVVMADDVGRAALKMFANLLAMGLGYRRIRLQPGQALLVDNGRWLHGRDPLPDTSLRRLRRWWLQRRHPPF